MRVNLHKHVCRGTFNLGRVQCTHTANVLVSDGFVATFLCVACSERAIVRKRLRQYNGITIPASMAGCGERCK